MIEDRDLAELCNTILTGVTVGVGSLVLLFSSGAQILLQCVFECTEGSIARSGHGENPNSSQILFGCLNHRVDVAVMDNNDVLILRFDDGMDLRIVPEQNGLESYVVTTRHGICPIVVSCPIQRARRQSS